MKKTKIVCTLGPATDSDATVTHLVASGMNVARLNFSHGNYDEHKERIDRVKRIREKLNSPVAVMLDTKGPEIRIKQFKDGIVNLKEGKTFTLYAKDKEGTEEGITVTYPNLAKEVKVGDNILIDDGLIRLVVRKLEDGDVICRIENGGELKNNKSINVPDVDIKLPAITHKDKEDIIFGIKNNVDFIAASFVRSKEDVLEIRKILEANNGENIKIISKIENRKGVSNIDEILEVSDGIMVARGDLGVEILTWEVPIVQKEIIRKCNKLGKSVITATQMLDSMIKNPRPTRAEVADVANAIFDGTDAIMLSGETAAGKYPVESVQAMSSIAEIAEANFKTDAHLVNTFEEQKTITNTISYATYTSSVNLEAKAIITPTGSGYTARMVSKFRPNAPIIAYTSDEVICRQLSLVWGVESFYIKEFSNFEELFESAVTTALGNQLIKEGDLVIITAGLPLGRKGTTNSIRIETVGQHLLYGKGIGTKEATGKFRVYNGKAIEDFTQGDILGVNHFSPELLPLLEKAAGIITTCDGLSNELAVAALNLSIPALIGVKDFNGYEDGCKIHLDPIRKVAHKVEM